jgi:hypothetical protein
MNTIFRNCMPPHLNPSALTDEDGRLLDWQAPNEDADSHFNAAARSASQLRSLASVPSASVNIFVEGDIDKFYARSWGSSCYGQVFIAAARRVNARFTGRPATMGLSRSARAVESKAFAGRRCL